VPGRWAVGVDGGGTRGRAWAAEADHDPARAPSGSVVLDRSCNPYAVGVEAAAEALLALIDATWRAAGREHASLAEAFVTIGLAGVDRDAERSAMTAALHAGGLAPERLELLGDPWIALEGALPAASSGSTTRVLLVSGTGSVAVAVAALARARVGGWGSRVGDEGSGAWLGIEAVRGTLRALDGRDREGALARAVQRAWGAGADALVGRARTAAPGDFAALAPLVLGHAGDDPAAGALQERAVAHLAELVVTAAEGVTPDGDASAPASAAVALAGGVATALAAPIAAALPEHLAGAIREAAGPPVAGAWSLARSRALAATAQEPQGRTTI
jgi:glucosamine kinase